MKIFLAAPISGFESETEYFTYRKKVVYMIEKLKKHYTVISELESVESVKSYDTPEQSVAKDFKAIKEADCFILMHPRKMQTSSFVELGYAYALGKPSLIISRLEDLPYMVRGLNSKNTPTIIVSPSDGNVQEQIEKILIGWEKMYYKY